MSSSFDRNELNLDGMPTPIIVAALDVVTGAVANGVFLSRTERELRQELNLWLKPSWTMAEDLQLAPEDFAQWVRLGKWNISNNPDTYALMRDCTSIAGNEGWKIIAIGMTPAEAMDKVMSEGRSELLEGIDALLALKAMSDSSRGKNSRF